MTVLKGILKDSWTHYQGLSVRIKRRLKELPAGSLFKRRIGKQVYYYLNLRKGPKVISKYLGKKPPADTVLSSLKCDIVIRGSVDRFIGRRVFRNLFPFFVQPPFL